MIFFWTILIIGVVFRLVSWSGRTAVQTDSVLYISNGINLFSGKGLVDLSDNPLVAKPPLYSFLIGIVWKISGDGEQAARSISFLFGIGSLALIYYFGRFLWTEREALAAMAVAAVYPALVNASSAAMAESLGLFWVILALFYLAKTLVRSKIRYAFLSGLFMSIAVWSRPAAWLMGWVVILLLLFYLWPKGNRKNTIKSILVFSFVFFLTLQPLMFYNFAKTHKWSTCPEGAGWLKIELDRQSDTTYEKTIENMGKIANYGKSVYNLFKESPGRFFKHYAENAYTFYKKTIPMEITPLFLLLTGIGLCVAPRNGYKSLVSLLPLILPAFAGVLMRGTEPRDVIPFVPLIILLSGAGIIKLWDLGKDLDFKNTGWIRGRLLSLVIIFLAFIFCLPGALKYKLDFQGQAVEHKEMGKWIKNNVLKPDRRIMSRKPMVVLYADGYSIGVVTESLEALREKAIKDHARFLCIDDRFTTRVYPFLKPFLNPDNAPSWLIYRHKTTSPDGYNMILYQFDFSGQ